MKNLIKLTFLLLLFGCSNNSMTPKNAEKTTTLEIINASSDECYAYAIIDNTLYILKDDIVIKQVADTSGIVKSLAFMLLVTIIGIIVYSVIQEVNDL